MNAASMPSLALPTDHERSKRLDQSATGILYNRRSIGLEAPAPGGVGRCGRQPARMDEDVA